MSLKNIPKEFLTRETVDGRDRLGYWDSGVFHYERMWREWLVGHAPEAIGGFFGWSFVVAIILYATGELTAAYILGSISMAGAGAILALGILDGSWNLLTRRMRRRIRFLEYELERSREVPADRSLDR